MVTVTFRLNTTGANFRERVANELALKGLWFFEEQLWSSAVQRKDLPHIRAFLENHGFLNVDVGRVQPSDDSAVCMRWARYYRKDGQCISSNYTGHIYAGSNHLKLTFGYETEEDRKKCSEQSIAVANILRLAFGVPIARELLVISHFSAGDIGGRFISDKAYASMFDTQEINRFRYPRIEEVKFIRMPEEASVLLDKAFSQTFPHEQFVLMWLAFEAIIHSHQGNESNGKKRQKFFLEELRSEIVNKEVYRLFKLRNDVFKEGGFRGHDFGQECWILYAVLQLSIMKNCPQRKAFLLGLETMLMSGTPPRVKR